MKKLFAVFALAMGLWLCAAPVYAPVPKSMEASGKEVVFQYQWRFEGDGGPAAEWLREELVSRGGWSVVEKSSQVIDFQKVIDIEHAEGYRLAVSSGRITVSAADESGFFRGVGRLLAILRHPSTIYTDTTVTLPDVSIADWPDYPQRIADLTMTFWEPFSDAERLASAKHIIEILAEHGYNGAVINFGSNYQSRYFASPRPTPWSQTDIRELIRFCKSRGVTPVPGFSTWSHTSSAPQIHIFKNEKGEIFDQDVRHPDFRKDYALVLDEMMELFDNPPYFRVGGDEAHGVLDRLKLSTEENIRIYTDLFNFIGDYLWEKYHCRAVLWHDMLFSAQLGGRREGDGFTEARVIPSQTAIDALSRNLILNYWNYGPAERYEGVDILREAGFEVWSSCWTIQAGIPTLAKYSYERGATGYVPTTWCWNHNKGGMLLYAGECAWNAQTEAPVCDYDELYLQEWNNAPWFPKANAATPIAFQGAETNEPAVATKVHLSNLAVGLTGGLSPKKTVIFPVRNSEEVHRALEEHPDVKFFVDGDERYDMEIDHVNGPRGFLELVLYTPEQGPTTHQNKWGEEWSVFDGQRVVDHYRTQPDTAIPPDGMLISINVSGADKHNNLRRLMSHGAIRLLASYPTGGDGSVLRATLKPDTRQVVLVFGARLWPFTEQPIDAVTVAAKCQETEETEKVSIYNDFALTPDPHFTGNFRKVFLPGGYSALVWNVPEDKTPESLELEFSALGLAMDLRLLAAVEMHNHQ